VLIGRRHLSLALVAPAILPVQAARAQDARLLLAQHANTGIERLREESRPAPAVSFTDADGKPHSFADFADHGLVVNLWATWCPPCVAEMPALDRLAAMLAEERITVLALSSDRGGRDVVQAFYERLNLRHLGIWLDPRGAAARGAGARGLPTTLIIDRHGMERARLAGEAMWDAPPLVEAVRRLVAPQARG
jgi:thiol-disulfide isomerase/thioredoxin